MVYQIKSNGRLGPIRGGTSVATRFWARVDKNGPVVDGMDDQCWQWVGHTACGYGVVCDNRKSIKVHRFSYQIHVGKIPDGLMVCHHCDNKLCVNPNHLFLGTADDNVQDMVAKGRQIKGVSCHSAKLTEDDVREIRRRFKGWDKVNGGRPLAREFGVTDVTIRNIVYRKDWKHVE